MNSQDIVLSEDEQIELSRRLRSATISQRDGRRARVILLAAQGCSRNDCQVDWPLRCFSHALVQALSRAALARLGGSAWARSQVLTACRSLEANPRTSHPADSLRLERQRRRHLEQNTTSP